jgi:oxygen-independent coproporphyrinogen-3 oxidase
VKSPRAYAAALDRGELPVGGREAPDAAGLELERVMLELRTASGVALDSLGQASRSAVEGVVRDGLAALEGGRLVLTRRGRLMADTVTRALMFL